MSSECKEIMEGREMFYIYFCQIFIFPDRYRTSLKEITVCNICFDKARSDNKYSSSYKYDSLLQHIQWYRQKSSPNVKEGNDRFLFLKRFKQQFLSPKIVNFLIFLNRNVILKGAVHSIDGSYNAHKNLLMNN